MGGSRTKKGTRKGKLQFKKTNTPSAMCLTSVTQLKPYKYISIYTKGLQNKVHTIRNLKNGNYHFWCVNEKGDIVDITPPELPPLNDKPIYIPWTKEEQEEQTKYCKEILFETEFPEDELEETSHQINDNAMWEMKKCFRNSFVYSICNPNYKLVCGSFGHIVEEELDFKVVSLDYGY
tara:strand:- start:71 stop:604 length:534 start_codon:yes stop_codon:yes gene_type:complete